MLILPPVEAIAISDLSVAFDTPQGSVRAVDALTLTVEQGQVFGFLGPNGAGKTTTMHVLLGFLPPTRGSACIFGTDVRHSIARRRIGFLPEHPRTYRFLSGVELLTMTGRLFGLYGRALAARVESILEQVDMTAAARRRVGTYSRGMLQRICLAQALINDPDLVILDETTGGLDPLGRLQIRGMIDQLRYRGKTVFFSSHELSEVELVCDHLAVMAHGRIVAAGPAKTLIPAGQSLERFFMSVVTESPHRKEPPAP